MHHVGETLTVGLGIASALMFSATGEVQDECSYRSASAPQPPPLLVATVGISALQVASPTRQPEPSLSGRKWPDGPTGGPPGDGPPPLLPPPLRRQNASRFSWPPDRNAEWCYIRFSPTEFVEQAAFSLGMQLSVRQVSEFFAAEAQDCAAYARYAARWREEIDAALQG